MGLHISRLNNTIGTLKTRRKYIYVLKAVARSENALQALMEGLLNHNITSLSQNRTTSDQQWTEKSRPDSPSRNVNNTFTPDICLHS